MQMEKKKLKKLAYKIFPIYTQLFVLLFLSCVILTILVFILQEPRQEITSLEQPRFEDGDQKVDIFYEGSKSSGNLKFSLTAEEATEEEKIKQLEEANEKLKTYFIDQVQEDQSITQNINLPETVNKCDIDYKIADDDLMNESGWFDIQEASDVNYSLYYNLSFAHKNLSDHVDIAIRYDQWDKSYFKNYEEVSLANKMKEIQNEVKKGIWGEDKTINLPSLFQVRYFTSSKGMSLSTFVIIILGVGPLLAVISRMELKEKKETDYQKKLIQLMYFMNHFILMYKTGLTISRSFEQAVENRLSAIGDENNASYITFKRLKERFDQEERFEEILVLFSETFIMPESRQFLHLLRQNIRQGDPYLLMHIETLSSNMWSRRIRYAREASEKAGTKLALPMMIIFMIIIMLSIVPTFFGTDIF